MQTIFRCAITTLPSFVKINCREGSLTGYTQIAWWSTIPLTDQAATHTEISPP